MKICKFMRHRGVDRMLKEALGDTLQLYRHSEDSFAWVDENNPLEFIQSDTPEDIEWDASIIDDGPTWTWMNESNIRTRNKIWYVHGTYETWEGFQIFANQNFTGYHTIFTDQARRASVLSWFENTAESSLILPIHLTDDYYIEATADKNGKCCIIGNRLLKNSGLNPNIKILGESIKKIHENLGDERLDIYGWNDREQDQITPEAILPKNCVKGSAIIRELGNYSVSFHPSFVPTLSFVQLEVMACGIPVVTTPKVDFEPVTSTPPPYIIGTNTNSFVEAVHKLSNDPELSYKIGLQGQKYLKENFPFASYKENLVTYLVNFLH